MKDILILDNLWYLIGGVLSISILGFTNFRHYSSGFVQASIALIIAYPIVLPILLAHIIKTVIREKDFMYTIKKGLCRKCGKPAYIKCEVGTSRSDIDNLYTTISCNCRGHNNSWSHFTPHHQIYSSLIKDNTNFSKETWEVSQEI